MHCSMTIAAYQFWQETKNSSNCCVQQSLGVPCETANLILLTLYFLLKLAYFFVKKVLSDNLENELAKL